MSSING